MFSLYMKSTILTASREAIYAIVQQDLSGLLKTSEYCFNSRDIKLNTKYYKNCWNPMYNISKEDLKYHNLLYETESKEDMVKFVEQLPIIEELEK